MININVTQKLYKKFDLDENGHLKQKLKGSNAPEEAVDINPLRDWHANLVIIQRRNCVLLVHDPTRFVVCFLLLFFAQAKNEGQPRRGAM